MENTSRCRVVAADIFGNQPIPASAGTDELNLYAQWRSSPAVVRGLSGNVEQSHTDKLSLVEADHSRQGSQPGFNREHMLLLDGPMFSTTLPACSTGPST